MSLVKLVATPLLALVVAVVVVARTQPTQSSPVVRVAVRRYCPVAPLAPLVVLQLPARALVAPAVAVARVRQVVPVPVPHTAQVAAVRVGATTASRLAPAVLVGKASC